MTWSHSKRLCSLMPTDFFFFFQCINGCISIVLFWTAFIRFLMPCMGYRTVMRPSRRMAGKVNHTSYHSDHASQALVVYSPMGSRHMKGRCAPRLHFERVWLTLPTLLLLLLPFTYKLCNSVTHICILLWKLPILSVHSVLPANCILVFDWHQSWSWLCIAAVST